MQILFCILSVFAHFYWTWKAEIEKKIKVCWSADKNNSGEICQEKKKKTDLMTKLLIRHSS